jgi:hypothetical protein
MQAYINPEGGNEWRPPLYRQSKKQRLFSANTAPIRDGNNKSACPSSSPSQQQQSKVECHRASLLGYSFDFCPDPAIKFVKGNIKMKEHAEKWLRSTREMLEAAELNSRKRTRHLEMYVGKGNAMPTPHSYRKEVFCDKSLLPDCVTHIRIQTDAEFKKSLADVLDYKDHQFLDETSKNAIDAIRDMPEFQGAAIRSMANKERDEWYEMLTSEESVSNANDFLAGVYHEAASTLKDLFKYTGRCAAFHDQTADSASRLSAYFWHKDTVGNIVCFCPCSGYSFNFVAMQSNCVPPPEYVKVKTGRMKEPAKIETTSASFNAYQAYKTSLPGESIDRKKIELFETRFLKEATALGLPRVHVYELQPGDKLIFTAQDYLHATIIPRQKDDIRRSLIVFHDLVPYDSKEFVY